MTTDLKGGDISLDRAMEGLSREIERNSRIFVVMSFGIGQGRISEMACWFPPESFKRLCQDWSYYCRPRREGQEEDMICCQGGTYRVYNGATDEMQDMGIQFGNMITFTGSQNEEVGISCSVR